MQARKSASDARPQTAVTMRTANAAQMRLELQEAMPAAAERQSAQALTVIADSHRTQYA